MATFNEANQIRVALKMKLSQHAWYSSSRVLITDDGFGIVVCVKHLDNSVRKIIPPVIDGVEIKTEVEI